jgi:hypothetical protein
MPISPDGQGANPPKGKFLNVVTRPKTGGKEFSYLLDQSGQARCHLWFSLLLIDKWGVQLHVRPLRLDMHINQKPLRLRTLPRALEGSINVFVNAVMAM